jgi:glycosyltransferase involved in cell wall biosynthesis
MKVLQINNYHYLRGGVETVYFQTSKILEKHGHEVIHFSTQNEKNVSSKTSKYFIKERSYLDKNLLEKMKSSSGFVYSRESAKMIDELIKDEKPDIAHLHIFFGQLSSSILKVLKKHKIPVVMTVHEYKMLCPTYLMLRTDGTICEKCGDGNYKYCIQYKCNKGNTVYSTLMAAESLVRDKFIPYEKYIDSFIFVSKFIYNKHMEYKPELKEKSRVIYNAFGNSIKAYKDRNYFLYVGRLSREKGILTLIKAMEKFPDKELKIVGDGPQHKELQDYILLKNLKNIELLGFHSGKSLDKLYQNADFLFMPSEWYETFGMTILESFSFGKPVAISNIGGMPEVLKNESNGFIFEPSNQTSLENTIERIIGLNQETYNEMGLSCIERVKQFSIKKYYSELIDVYNGLVNP